MPKKEKEPLDIEVRLRTWASNAVDCLYKKMFLEAADLIQELRSKEILKDKKVLFLRKHIDSLQRQLEIQAFHYQTDIDSLVIDDWLDWKSKGKKYD